MNGLVKTSSETKEDFIFSASPPQRLLEKSKVRGGLFDCYSEAVRSSHRDFSETLVGFPVTQWLNVERGASSDGVSLNVALSRAESHLGSHC